VGEIVRHEQSGLLFDPGNATELAASVKRLWGDRALRSRLGDGARSQFEAFYTAERNYRMIMEIFEHAAV
jgi:glycosyltransferase involved in cell wall biosynthesis